MIKSKIEVELLDCMGSDLTVANAARVSMDVHHEKFDEKDETLIKNLAEWDHWTPFAHPHLSIRVKAPIFVARQLAKHQVGLVWSEVSRRYVSTEPEFFIPEMREKGESIKDGSSDKISEYEDTLRYSIDVAIGQSLHSYNVMLHYGIAPEIARTILPQNMMTQWVWTGSLAAFARIIELRLGSHAQKETRQVASMIEAIIAQKFPVSSSALASRRIR